MFCHLTLNLAVTVALCHISLLTIKILCCCVPPSVSGPPSLILLLWVPLKGCLSHMSIWSPQCVANPTPYSYFYLLSYQSPPCLPPQLWPIQPHTGFFISSPTSHRPAYLYNSSFQIGWSHQMYRILLRHLLKNTCNFWFSSLVSLPSFCTIQEYNLHI